VRRPAARSSRWCRPPIRRARPAIPPRAPSRRARRPGSAHADQAPRSATGDAPAESAYDRARKLEQIKDLYLTAEAIGEANVDKHFDQLLAQQRELISDYFRQPAGGRPAAARGRAGRAAEPEPAEPARQPARAPPRPRGVPVTADQPRVW
jgi:hypothetical protein